MKYRNLRQLVPVAASLALLYTAYVNEHVLADNNNKYDEDNLIPKYINSEFILEDNELIILNLSDSDLSNYDTINSNEIENIIYSDNKEFITINLKNSDIYYTGYYNVFYQKYIYTKTNDKIKEYVKSN